MADRLDLEQRLRDSYILGRHPDGTPYDTMEEAATELARLRAIEQRAKEMRELRERCDTVDVMAEWGICDYILNGRPKGGGA